MAAPSPAVPDGDSGNRATRRYWALGIVVAIVAIVALGVIACFWPASLDMLHDVRSYIAAFAS